VAARWISAGWFGIAHIAARLQCNGYTAPVGRRYKEEGTLSVAFNPAASLTLCSPRAIAAYRVGEDGTG
jgi:hypothetical protein